MKKPKAFVSDYKKEEVKTIKGLLKNHKVVGLADITGFPSPQLQKIRSNLKDKLLIRITKSRLIKLSMDELKEEIKGIDRLKESLEGMPALLLSNQEPFKLAKSLSKSKSSAPAKAGQIAPKDLIINAGPTSFAPGPIIGELGAAGLKAGVEGGKIVIKEDKVIAKKGDTITPKIVDLLSKFKIEPMEIGLKITSLLEDGTLYGGNVLSIDEKQYINNLRQAHSDAFALSLEIGYITKENIELLIKKAEIGALALKEKLPAVEEKVEEKKEEPKLETQGESIKEQLKENIFPKEEKSARENTEATKEKPAENIVEEIVKKAETGELKPEEEKTKSQINPIQDEMRKAEEFVKGLMGGEVKSEDLGKGAVELRKEKQNQRNKKEKEDKEFKEAEKAAQNILKKI
ncbi:50S ribosomal protein L10 [Candidatus Woesearchaeota archaeon]|nr:50S ribosomal protein L10 [Candidatus Woesearchaeota archaeon]